MLLPADVHADATSRITTESLQYEFEPGVNFQVYVHNTHIHLNGELLFHVLTVVVMLYRGTNVTGLASTACGSRPVDWRILADRIYIQWRDSAPSFK